MSLKSKPAIGIDFHVAGGIYQGVRTYLTNLIREVLRLDHQSRYFIYANDYTGAAPWCQKGPNVAVKRLPTASGRLNLLFGFPACAYRDRLSLFHSQYVLPIHLPCRSVVTIHDILFESHPQFFPPFHRGLLKLFIPLSARRASKVVAVSEFTKREIVKHYKVSEDKIAVVCEGASEGFSRVSDQRLIARTLGRYGITDKYILFVGRIEPRKNIVGVLEAFDYVKKKGGRDLCLVVVGQQDRLFQEKRLFEAVKEMKSRPDILFTGGVSEEELAVLYNGAEVLVYPAFAEGFGLPVLEAMSCGTPVITSNTTSLPEVAGDAAVLVDPHSVADIGANLENLLDNETLRKELSARGLKRAQAFGWAKAAEQTLDVYAEVLNPI